MNSKRFPGKTLYHFNGKPSIDYLIDSLLQSFGKDRIIIATSTTPSDNQIESYCLSKSINYYRGDENNVASRFLNIIEKYNPDHFARLSADSPLFDHRILAEAFKTEKITEYDIITTVNTRQFPSGMNVEIVSAKTFIKNYSSFSCQDHFEHVTNYFYENKEKFSIFYLKNGVDNPENYKFSFDTVEDKSRIEQFFKGLVKPHYEYTLKEKCKLYHQFSDTIC